MTPRSLFNIIIKIFGLFFLKETINTIIQFGTSLIFFVKGNATEELVWGVIITSFVVAIYTFIFFKLVFNTNYVIDKLKLDQGFNQAEFSFNISTPKILMIALFVVAGVILVNEIPNLCSNLFSDFQEIRLSRVMTKINFSYSILSVVKIVLALLLIGERNRIINFVEKRRSKKETGENG
jgi:NADH:ubiquinone oxidoreductase subunit 5 (subunit L)/multisubunit Na+/H+ antiporter MnhA subunit